MRARAPGVSAQGRARSPGELDRLPAPWRRFWTCNASAQTSQVRAVDGFDEAGNSWGAEDIDLGYRLHRNGARFVLRREACGECWHQLKLLTNSTNALSRLAGSVASNAWPPAALAI